MDFLGGVFPSEFPLKPLFISDLSYSCYISYPFHRLWYEYRNIKVRTLKQTRSMCSSRATYFPRRWVILPAETFKSSLNPFPSWAILQAEAILKTCMLFIYGDIHYVTNSFFLNMCQKYRPSSLGCDVHFFKNKFSYYYQFFLLHVIYIKHTHIKLYL